jgi:hypothetical protein
MIPRLAEASARRLAGWYPVVVITGPRQSGKTTLARAVFADRPYVSLEDLDVREAAQADPRAFLRQYADGAVFDEVQRVPQLFSYLQTVVDGDRRTGRFILTGSQQFGMLREVSQSLAGRAGMLHLLPFTLAELASAGIERPLADTLLAGFYPPIHDRGIPPERWFADYVATYLERDVRELQAVRDLRAFRTFVRMCAARTAQLVNLTGLAADCGITHNTAKAWLSILEASYLVFTLSPHFANFGKRLVKTPKLYFHDTGLAAWLAGVRSVDELRLGSLRGPLFENYVVAECVKARCNGLLPHELHFWRDSAGHEIDLVISNGDALHPVEIKAGETVAGDWFAPVERFMGLSGATRGTIVHGGQRAQSRAGIDVLPWLAAGDLVPSPR